MQGARARARACLRCAVSHEGSARTGLGGRQLIHIVVRAFSVNVILAERRLPWGTLRNSEINVNRLGQEPQTGRTNALSLQ